MVTLLVLRNSQRWEDAIKKGNDLIKKEDTYLLVIDEAVTRCIRCEPTLFRYLHQFILDGGKALVCETSLAKYDIPSGRPPDIFDRIKDGKAFTLEKEASGWKIIEF